MVISKILEKTVNEWNHIQDASELLYPCITVTI
jgi:hypothetical protein